MKIKIFIFILGLIVFASIGHAQEEGTLSDCFYKITDKKSLSGRVCYVMR